LLALSFSILKGFGVQNQLDETLNAALQPLGVEKAAQITENLIGFVNNMNVGVLGAVGLGFLIFTVVSLMQKIESAFNSVWRVRTSRTFGERFTTFLSAITVGPLLIFAAIAITGSVMSTSLMTQLESIAVIGEVIDLIARLVPFALVITAFTFLYASIPNTSVRLTSALTGGVVAGVLWELLSVGFATYAAGTSSYQLIYATFATAILFMIWLYLNWAILLIGASIAFYRQHPEVVMTGLKEVHLSTALTTDYTLSLLTRVGRRFYSKEPGYTLEALATEYGTPSHVLEHCLDLLVDVGVLKKTVDEGSRYLPGVPFDTTTVVEVLEQVDGYQPENTYSPPQIDEPDITAIGQATVENRAKALAGLTLKQLALGEAT
jgi:membrane protein